MLTIPLSNLSSSRTSSPPLPDCTVIVAVLIPVLLRRLWSKDLEQAAADPVDEEGGEGEEGDRLLNSNREDDEEREVGGWNSSASGGGRERPFRLDSDSEEDEGSDGEEERGKGKARAAVVEGSQGEWEESSLDRRGTLGAVQQTGDMTKASKLLGVTVGR